MEAVLNETEAKKGTWGPAALEQRRERSRNHLAKIAGRREGWIDRNRYYYELLNRLLRFLVEPQKRVLSVRCGTGNLLANVQSTEGKGVDICPEIVEIAQQRNPSLEFAVAFPDKEEFRTVFEPEEKFDYILFNDIGDTSSRQRRRSSTSPRAAALRARRAAARAAACMRDRVARETRSAAASLASKA